MLHRGVRNGSNRPDVMYISLQKMNEEEFHSFLVDSFITPEPLPDNGVTRIFNSGARGKGYLGFEEFCECLERVSVKAFQNDDLSESEAMLELLRSVARSKVARSLPSFLHPEHALVEADGQAEDEEEEEEEAREGRAEGASEDEQAYEGGLSLQQTEDLLRALFQHYSNDDNAGHMSAGKFYKMVRECRLLDGLVTQEKVASLFKEVMKTGKGGATHIEYPDYIQALAMLSQIKFENCDGPIQVQEEEEEEEEEEGRLIHYGLPAHAPVEHLKRTHECGLAVWVMVAEAGCWDGGGGGGGGGLLRW